MAKLDLKKILMAKFKFFLYLRFIDKVFDFIDEIHYLAEFNEKCNHFWGFRTWKCGIRLHGKAR